jgi:agmatinase
MGARVITIKEIRERGMDKIVDDALNIAHKKTKHVFVTICSDCTDAGFNPGGPPTSTVFSPMNCFQRFTGSGSLVSPVLIM